MVARNLFLQPSLSGKLVWMALGFFFVALTAVGITLYESWKLEGGAAVINDMGSERMRSYRIAYLLSEQLRDDGQTNLAEIREEMRHLHSVLETLQRGDPARPLVLPRDPEIVSEVEAVRRHWIDNLEPRIEAVIAERDRAERSRLMSALRPEIEQFVVRVDGVVRAVEMNNSVNSAMLRYMQMGLIALAIVGTVTLVHLMFLLVVRPVTRLKEGMQRMTAGDLTARLPVETRDEFGDLAVGFNRMGDALQDTYETLEQRVAEKTRDLADRNRELSALYEVTTLLNEPASIEELCRGFLRRLMSIYGARGGAVRLIDPVTRDIHIFVQEGLQPEFTRAEQCRKAGECACGEAVRDNTAAVEIATGETAGRPRLACALAGYDTVSIFAIRFKRQQLGIFNLFFEGRHAFGPQESHALETLGRHLGVAIENQRLVSRDKELAVAEERNLLAQELHDSIAQSLAYLNLQAQMLQDSLARGNIAEGVETVAHMREGVQESYDDVRELLVHFRTRVKRQEDMGNTLRGMAERFEAQTGIGATYAEFGTGVPLAAESQLQVLHILQEALSNVRKHSGATAVALEMTRGDEYRFVVRDNGRGFEARNAAGPAGDHIGLRIMSERSHRIGAQFSVDSAPGAGTTVTLRLAVAQKQAA